MAIFLKVYKHDNFQSQISLKLSFTSIQGPYSNFVGCEFFFESKSPGIGTLCETKLDDLNESSNFSVRAYLPLIRKDSVTLIHGLVFYMKELLPFSWDCSLENSEDP